MKRFLYFILILFTLLPLPSCKLFYPNIMFRQKDYQYFDLAQKQIEQYIIKPGDQFAVYLYSRDGFRLIDVLGAGNGNINAGGSNGNINSYQSNSQTSSGGSMYLVDYEGFAKLPILGQFYVQGYTESELERVLEEKYSSLFIDPYVVVTVTNRRVFVFRGSSANVVSLNQSPTNLLEIIAKSGGIGVNLKSYKIKIIRGDLKNPQVYLVDLSTLEGMRKANLILQSNDIVYIEPRRQVVTDALTQLTPVLAITSTIFTTIALIKAFGAR